MKFNYLTTLILAGTLSIGSLQAQETVPLSLQEAVQLALKNGTQTKIAEDQVNTAAHELQSAKNLRYPDLSIGGQYQYIPSAKVNFHQQSSDSGSGESGGGLPNVNQILLAQAQLSMPIFTGFQLKNTVDARSNAYQAATFNAANEKEKIAMEAIQAYINLFKAKNSIELIEENLKSAQQRVFDFSEMEKNGLLAKNDLLKAQLQASHIEISLEEARKNAQILNYQLAVLLDLPEEADIVLEENQFDLVSTVASADSLNRKDLLALNYQSLAAENQVKIAQSKYYPKVSLVGGYINLDIHNAMTVTNAVNVGVGVSYRLSDILKAKSEVAVARSKASELQHHIEHVQDQVSIQVKNAEEEYSLAQKKYEVYLKSQEQAIENYRIVKDKYDNGLQDTNDLLEADVEQLQAQINLAFAKADISQKYFELLSTKGNLTDTLTTN